MTCFTGALVVTENIEFSFRGPLDAALPSSAAMPLPGPSPHAGCSPFQALWLLPIPSPASRPHRSLPLCQTSSRLLCASTCVLGILLTRVPKPSQIRASGRRQLPWLQDLQWPFGQVPRADNQCGSCPVLSPPSDTAQAAHGLGQPADTVPQGPMPLMSENVR